ncbi:MAG: alpha/beta fold hydrolase [Bacillota bacterium]
MKYNKIILIILLLIIILTNLELAKANEKPFLNSEFKKIGNVKLHYRIFQENKGNSKEKILLIHGMGGSTYCWRNNTKFLSEEGYQVVAVDLPGFGYSNRQAGLVHSSENRAIWLMNLLDYLDEEVFHNDNPWFLMGHSMGAKPISQMALYNSEKFKGLIYIGGAVYNSTPEIAGEIIGNWPFRPIAKVILDKFFLKRGRIENFLNSAYGEDISGEEVDAYLEPLQIEGTAEVWLDLLKSSSPALENISNIKLPALLIWGENDSWVPLEEGKMLNKELINSQLEIIEESHHMPMVTDYKKVNKYIKNFIEQINGNKM